MVIVTKNRNPHEVYHTSNCQGVGQIHETKEIPEQEAKAQGLTECKKCQTDPKIVEEGRALVPKRCGSESVYHTRWCPSAKRLQNPKTWSLEYVKRSRASHCSRCKQASLD